MFTTYLQMAIYLQFFFLQIWLHTWFDMELHNSAVTFKNSFTTLMAPYKPLVQQKQSMAESKIVMRHCVQWGAALPASVRPLATNTNSLWRWTLTLLLFLLLLLIFYNYTIISTNSEVFMEKKNKDDFGECISQWVNKETSVS